MCSHEPAIELPHANFAGWDAIHAPVAPILGLPQDPGAFVRPVDDVHASANAALISAAAAAIGCRREGTRPRHGRKLTAPGPEFLYDRVQQQVGNPLAFSQPHCATVCGYVPPTILGCYLMLAYPPVMSTAARRVRGGAAPESGQIVYTKIPYSACMNSFRIEWLESFHAISHGIPVRPAPGPRLLEARQEWVEFMMCAGAPLRDTFCGQLTR